MENAEEVSGAAGLLPYAGLVGVASRFAHKGDVADGVDRLPSVSMGQAPEDDR
jgi:hypothetical protein